MTWGICMLSCPEHPLSLSQMTFLHAISLMLMRLLVDRLRHMSVDGS